jgi:hypothetical protein
MCRTGGQPVQNEHEQRRWRLVGVVERYFRRDNDQVARVIEERTGAKVSERTVQAWLSAPGRTSSRNCPEWAVKALEDFVADPVNEDYLARLAQRREDVASGEWKSPLTWSDKVRREKAVELATSSLEVDAKRQRTWQDAGGLQIGGMLFELERRVEGELSAQRRVLTALSEAFRTGATFEELRSVFQEQVKASELQDFFVGQAKRAIESGSEEFAASDGVLKQPDAAASG